MREQKFFRPKNSKYERKPLQLPGIEFKDHIFVGIVWPYTNRKGDTYHIEMTSKGYKCECIGFQMHGKCKHIHGVHERIIESSDLRV